MEKSIKGSKTEQNLLKAFAGESQARNRYDFFAKQAKKDGYEQIAAIFAETALQEHQHAKQFFKHLEGEMVEITATYPAGKIQSTLENLKASAAGENEEWTDLYPAFADIAEEEGYADVANTFRMITRVEKVHEERYNKLVKNIEENKVFEKESVTKWQCTKCGYVHEGEKALDKCPACAHPKEYQQIFPENY